MDSEDLLVKQVSTRTKILAYLGELKKGEYVSSKKIVADLSLRFTTAKNVLTQLEEQWLVEKQIRTEHGTVALFRISPTATMTRTENGVANMESPAVVPFVPPEWSDAYGKHPSGI